MRTRAPIDSPTSGRSTAPRGKGRREKDHKAMARREGLAIIQGVLSPGGNPVLGLFIYSAALHVLRLLRSRKAYRKIRPHLIGTPAILSRCPGLSQTELAVFLGCERATAGLQVTECVRLGWVRRARSVTDARCYKLFITESGRRMLREVVPIVKRHEATLGRPLISRERAKLASLLQRLM